MADLDGPGCDTRVLLLAPTSRDAVHSHRLLTAAGLGVHVCKALEDVCREVRTGAGAVVVPEEVLLRDRSMTLVAALRDQPRWSALPVIVLTAAGRTPGQTVRTLLGLGEVSFLKRPIEVEVFLTAVRSALRDRDRQYQVRDHLAEQAKGSQLLRDADRRKDEFLAMLAHELRNPLAPIRNSLALLKFGSKNPEVVTRASEMMDRQVQHLVRLVDDLLDVSRINLGKVDLRLEEIDLGDIVANAAETAAPLMTARKHRLTINRPRRPVRLRADPTRLAQVIGNLLNNAAKYTDESGHITLAFERDGIEAVVRVRDTGAGIAAEMLPRVFDLFTQADQTIDRAQGGLGVGLALVRTLVGLHGGTVRATSPGLGKGSEFFVHLPALPEIRVAEPEATAGPVPSRRPGCRILIVDDSTDAADSLAMILGLGGDEVRTVATGPAALQTAAQFRPHLVLLDLGLPGMDGYEVARRLRETTAGNRIRIAALTGYGQEEDRRRTQTAGFDHHLVKPADPTAIEKIVAEIIAAQIPKSDVVVGTGSGVVTRPDIV
ncbi:ATP-binding protein [Fimbriiglobus ruber]|uniref:histidine kinase n=1 Tax=Fimbriiglobus ruber TaxID=1908690 RepID=A0A225D8U9_9BACT|nr:ATP-binding protein [Fimbriiglobus ruber]OWK37981.1 Chemotaxis protein methyltransferase CheR [Fimbriiglobus ruber]